jgi:hypothetical protein
VDDPARRRHPLGQEQVRGIACFAVALLSAVVLACAPESAAAQASAPPANAGAVKLTAGVDVPSLYYFRGIRQETDPRVTLWPYGDVGITLVSADRGLKSVAVNVGVWNSLHTGTSGSKGASGKSIHYQENFYSTLTVGFSPVRVSAKYIAYTSPNPSFTTDKEVDFQLTGAQKYAPYGLVAFELGKGEADGGKKKGTYLELGAAPNWLLGTATFSIPVAVGLSLKDYYEGANGDKKFGYVDVGGMITVPFSSAQSKDGSWNVHGRADYMRFGSTTKAFNKGKASGYWVMGGIGLSY